MDPVVLRELITSCRLREDTAPEQYPVENVHALQDARFISGPFTRAEGGLDWSPPDSVHAIELLAAAAPSTALIASMPLGLAGIFAANIEPITGSHHAAWMAQKDWLTAEYRAGHLFAACNSEKGAGGSLAAIQTRAARAGETFRLTGEKILATSGQYAHWFFSTARVSPDDLPDAGVVEFFFVPTAGTGVDIADDWDGFGMRSTESHTVHYHDAPAEALAGFPDFIATVQPLQYWFCLFAAIPLGCARGMLEVLGTPAPSSPALRLRLNEAWARYEATRAYLLETAAGWHPGADGPYAARVLRTKTHVTQEAVRLCADLFALSGGRHYRQGDPLARRLADAFAGTALRPPLALALSTLSEQFELDLEAKDR